MDWTHVDFLWIVVMFLSAVWTLILAAPIHSKSTGEQFNVKLNFSKSVNMKKLLCIFDGLNFQQIFIFGVNYSLME